MTAAMRMCCVVALLAAAIAAAFGQSNLSYPVFITRPRASFQTELKPLCGLNTSHEKFELLTVACVDFDAMRAFGVPLPPTSSGKVTQVLVHLRNREAPAVRVMVDGVAQIVPVTEDPQGRRVAMAQFEGIEHAELRLQVLVVEP